MSDRPACYPGLPAPPQIERIGWMMQAEDHEAYPGGRLFTNSLAAALAARLLGLQSRRHTADARPGRALPPWRLRLLEGGRSLTEIALEAGFAHSGHMARCMRRMLGLSPSQVAESAR